MVLAQDEPAAGIVAASICHGAEVNGLKQLWDNHAAEGTPGSVPLEHRESEAGLAMARSSAERAPRLPLGQERERLSFGDGYSLGLASEGD